MFVFCVWDLEYFETIDSNKGGKIFLSEVVSVFCFFSNGVNVEEARLCRQPPVVHYCRFILLCVQNGGRRNVSFFLSFIAALFFCGAFFWRLNNNNNRCDGCVGELDSCNAQWIVVSHQRSFLCMWTLLCVTNKIGSNEVFPMEVWMCLCMCPCSFCTYQKRQL